MRSCSVQETVDLRGIEPRSDPGHNAGQYAAGPVQEHGSPVGSFDLASILAPSPGAASGGLAGPLDGVGVLDPFELRQWTRRAVGYCQYGRIKPG
jgi:hypothetical protein